VTDHLPMPLEQDDVLALNRAAYTLENPSFAAKLSGVVGTPIEVALKLLPTRWYNNLHEILEKSIQKGLESAIESMGKRREPNAHEMYHKFLVAGTGAAGGLFGLPSLALELPVTTTLMLRSIAEIARDEGENLQDAGTQAACIEVFALGGRSELDDTADTGYYGVRLALASYMTSTMRHIASHGADSASATGLVRLIRAATVPFGISLSQRAATRLIPVVGAGASATVNVLFMQHFQSVARAHFTMRRLERKYGRQLMEARYHSVANSLYGKPFARPAV
jgi:hypothetical protein